MGAVTDTLPHGVSNCYDLHEVKGRLTVQFVSKRPTLHSLQLKAATATPISNPSNSRQPFWTGQQAV